MVDLAFGLPPVPRPEREESLRQDPIARVNRVGVGSNSVFAVVLDTARGPTRAIYKPARGERPLWDFPHGTLYRREVAAAEVDLALGWELLPVTVIRTDAPFGDGSIQEFVEEPAADITVDHDAVESQLRGLAALDVVLNNADRKSAHLLIDEHGHLKGIDHGVTFNTEFKLRTVLADLGGSPVPKVWLQGIQALLEDRARLESLRARLSPLLDKSEITAFERRSSELLAHGEFPRLHPWYGRPFEW